MKKIIFFLVLFCTKALSQISVSPTSSIACNSTSSAVIFTITSGAAPYNFIVQTPTCASSYTFGSSSANPTLTFNCPGVYSITINDASNNLLGSVNHTVILSAFILVEVLMDADENDTICRGKTVLIYGHMINPITWNTGETMASINVSPTVTTTYSFTGIYDGPGSRTCTANGYKTIVVQPCTVNFDEIGGDENFIRVFPNPLKDKLHLELQQNVVLPYRLTISNSLGQEMFLPIETQDKQEIDISFLSKGFYYLKFDCGSKQKVMKIIRE